MVSFLFARALGRLIDPKRIEVIMSSEITITDILAEMQRLGISQDSCNDSEVKTFQEIKAQWGIGAVQTRQILHKLHHAGLLTCKRLYRPRIDGTITAVPGYILAISKPQVKSKGVKHAAAKKTKNTRQNVAARTKKATRKGR